MKKWMPAFLVLSLMLALAYWIGLAPPNSGTMETYEVPKTVLNESATEMTPPSVQVDKPVSSQGKPESIDPGFLELTLNSQLDPRAIEEFTKARGLKLGREINGHPKSGQRLELTWGTSPQTTAVFDIMGSEKYVLSSVRSLYPAGSSLADLKAMLKAKVQRPVEHEDENSLIFASDDQGLTVWLALSEDESIKVASEYGAHSHAAPHP